MAVKDLATIADLEHGWRSLASDEKEIAQTLITRASAIVLRELRDSGKTLDGMDVIDKTNAATVVCDMVAYAMDRGNIGNSAMFPDTADSPMWETSPTAASLYLTDKHRRQLGIAQVRVSSVRPCSL